MVTPQGVMGAARPRFVVTLHCGGFQSWGCCRSSLHDQSRHLLRMILI
jgi:hypothetical protein